MKKINKIALAKICTLCPKKGIVGVVDFGVGGTHITLCEEHLLKFCRKTIDDSKK